MIVLKNINKSNGMIEADFYRANYENPGHVVVSISEGEIIESVAIPGCGSCEGDLYHAREFLNELAKYDSFSDKYYVEWY